MIRGATGGKVRILVIEDNPGDVELLRLALKSVDLDCDLTVVEDGADALALARQQGDFAVMPRPDLAILDLNLPKYDGLEILEALRANQAYADMPVAVLSSSSSPRDRASMDVFRIRRYIVKPADLDEFLKIGQVIKDLLLEVQAGRTPSC